MGEVHTTFSLENLKGKIPRRRRKDNTRRNLGKIGWKGVEWIHLDEAWARNVFETATPVC
jgi:hypothetical protein